MFNYEYKEEASKELPTPGNATFSVHTVYDKGKDGQPLVTKSTGMPMLKLELFVTDCRGLKVVIYEHLTSAMGWKVKALGECLAIPGIHNPNGSFNPQSLLGKEGECIIKIENSSYGDKAVVDKYLPSSQPAARAAAPARHSPAATQAPETTFDDIPF